MRKGFTLVETLMAVVIFATVIAIAMGGWLQFMVKSNHVNTQASLDMDVRRVVERFRFEARNTARESIIFFPEGAEPYSAVGFALPADSDADGLMDMAGSNILWRQTVIYHVWNHSPHQMRRTLFANRHPDATYAERYDQIAAVVNDGHGAEAAMDGEIATTTVLFENLFTGRLWHASSTFDGYAPAGNTRARLSLGSLPLGPGAHTVNFTVTGKNPNSTGWKLRLDRVSAGVAGWPVEAEASLRAPGGVSGTAPVFAGQGLASAAYGLVAPAAVDDTLSLTVYNDAIEDGVFIGEGRNVAFSNTVVRFDTNCTPAGFPQGVQVAKLDGQYTTAWRARRQVADAMTPVPYEDEFTTSDLRFTPGTNCAVRIPVQGKHVDRDGYGPIFRMHYSGFVSPNRFKIWDPSFAATDATNSPSISEPLTPLRIYQNGILKEKWEDCSVGYIDLRPEKLVPIYANQNFIFSFWLTVNAPGDMIRSIQIPNASSWHCWMVRGGNAEIASAQDWSDYSVEAVFAKDTTNNDKLCIPGLLSMTVNFADGGDFISHPYDTKSEAPKAFEWIADVPSGASLALYARSGDVLTEDGFNIAGAMDWFQVEPAVSGGGFAENTGRYVQFRAVFTAQPAKAYPGGGGIGSSGPYRSNTPRLRLARFTWDGEEKYVEVSADLMKSPDCGMFTVDVDGQGLVQGVTMEIEIFKDVRTLGNKKTRLRSAMTAEIDPRNSLK